MTLVLTSGLPATDPTSRPANLAHVDDVEGSATDPVVALGNLAAPVLTDGGTVLAVVATWARDPALRHLQTLRSALETTRLVIYPTLLPPLSATAFATLLAECAATPGVTGADLLAHLDELEGTVVGAAWLGSVARLHWPSPSMRQHARSLLPRSRYAAIIDGRPRIVRLAKDELIPLPEADQVGWRAVMAAGDGDVACAERSLSRVTTTGRVTTRPLDEISSGWWGTDKLVELALRPHDVATVVDYLVSSRPSGTCGWCGQQVADEVCPFCGMRQSASQTSSSSQPSTQSSPRESRSTSPDRSALGAHP